MNQKTGYKPGFYGKKRPSAAEWADRYIKKYAQDEADKKQVDKKPGVMPSVCFSRQIGVGALEIADLLAGMIHYRVIDREILEHMAKDANLSRKMIEFYDERYPGRASELFSMLISEKTFLKSDYARQLAKTVTTLAASEPTIFVGRGMGPLMTAPLRSAVSMMSFAVSSITLWSKALILMRRRCLGAFSVLTTLAFFEVVVFFAVGMIF